MVPTRRDVGSTRTPGTRQFISPVISVTQSPFANLFVKIRQLYQLLCPVRLQVLVSESTLLCTILFHSNLSRIVILGNMFLVPSIATSRRCSDYLNHTLKTLFALICPDLPCMGNEMEYIFRFGKSYLRDLERS